MSLYPISRSVWCKPLGAVGTIAEANYATVNGKRKAEYIVHIPTEDVTNNETIATIAPAINFLVGSKDLRAADWCCEGCGRWLRGQPFKSEIIYAYGEQDDRFDYCFLCVNLLEATPEQRQQAAHDGYPWYSN